jgi:Na+-transporting methylmalonyl-CoA/oxaloacetate decarboxylase gamma subunit
MNFLPIIASAVWIDSYGTWGEQFGRCGRMILIGMGTVFLVLAVLWGVISVFGAVAKLKEKKERERIMEEVRNSPAPNDVKAVKPEAGPVFEEEEEAEDPGVLIAVITAAVEAYRAAAGLPAGGYRVVSFRRKNTKKSWNGRDDG